MHVLAQAIKDHQETIGKLSPYLDDKCAEVQAAKNTAATAKALETYQRCVATRFERHFVAAWKSTVRNFSRQHSRITNVNDWLTSQEQADTSKILSVFWEEHQRILGEGDKGPAPPKKSEKAEKGAK